MALENAAPVEKEKKPVTEASKGPSSAHAEVEKTQRDSHHSHHQSKEATAHKEDALFKDSSKAFAKPVEGHPAKAAEPKKAEAKGAGKAEPAVLDLNKTIETKKPEGPAIPRRSDTPIPRRPEADTRTDGQQILDTSAAFWADAVKSGKAEGGVAGHLKAAGAFVAGLGVDAAKTGHEAYTNFFPDGAIDPAVRYWQEYAKEGQKQGGIIGDLKSGTGKAASGLLNVSGLGDVERGVNLVAKDVNQGAPTEQLKDHAKSLAVDGTLAALTFIPAATGIKGIVAGEAALKTAAAGTRVAGMAATESSLAGKVAEKLTSAIADTLPGVGEKLTKYNTAAFVGRLENIASQYGIKLEKGGLLGESTGTINKIEFNTKVGGNHEVGHLLQQLQSRATALESVAQNLGKDVKALTAAEREIAYNSIVKPFENIAYNQHEMFAGAAHSWGRTAANYGQILKENVSSFQVALSNGTVPEAAVKVGARLYGQLPNFLGRSQLEIAKNLASPFSLFLQNGDLKKYI